MKNEITLQDFFKGDYKLSDLIESIIYDLKLAESRNIILYSRYWVVISSKGAIMTASLGAIAVLGFRGFHNIRQNWNGYHIVNFQELSMLVTGDFSVRQNYMLAWLANLFEFIAYKDRENFAYTIKLLKAPCNSALDTLVERWVLKYPYKYEGIIYSKDIRKQLTEEIRQLADSLRKNRM